MKKPLGRWEEVSAVVFKKKHTRIPLAAGDTMRITLKGEALICAVAAGLVPATEDGRGYNIGPFLKFWEAFSMMLPKELEEDPDEVKKIIEMIEEHRNQRTNQK